MMSPTTKYKKYIQVYIWSLFLPFPFGLYKPFNDTLNILDTRLPFPKGVYQIKQQLPYLNDVPVQFAKGKKRVAIPTTRISLKRSTCVYDGYSQIFCHIIISQVLMGLI